MSKEFPIRPKVEEWKGLHLWAGGGGDFKVPVTLPSPPLCMPFFKQTTYNRWRIRNYNMVSTPILAQYHPPPLPFEKSWLHPCPLSVGLNTVMIVHKSRMSGISYLLFFWEVPKHTLSIFSRRLERNTLMNSYINYQKINKETKIK